MLRNDLDHTDAQSRRRTVGYRPAFRAVIVHAPSVSYTVILITWSASWRLAILWTCPSDAPSDRPNRHRDAREGRGSHRWTPK